MIDRPVVYTALFGEGDELRDPLHPSPEVDYICFSDRPRKTNVFEIREIHSTLDHRKQAKETKLRPHIFLPDYSVSLWMDASMSLLVSDMEAFIDTYGSLYPFLLFSSERKTVAEEVEYCIRNGKDIPNKLLAQLSRYREELYPDTNGLYKGGFLLREHLNPSVVELDEDWWGENIHHTLRDEVSLPYVLWNHGWKQEYDFSVFPYDVRDNPLMRVNKHIDRL